MTPTWHGDDRQVLPRIGPLGWMLALARGVPLAMLVFGGLILLLCVRLAERPLCGVHRPATPHITRFVCRMALRILGIDLRVEGAPMARRGAVVANHSSWLDIFVLNASKRIYFVSKSEVARWPGIGWLARATGTVFINRQRAQARAHANVIEDRLLAGHKLLFFPEGTSTDGMQVLPFRTTLFEAFFAAPLRDQIAVQPVSVVYLSPKGADRRFYGWWGDTGFGEHLLVTLARWRQGGVHVIYHPPLPVSDFANRKALAQACERAVRAGHERVSESRQSA